MAQDTFFSSKKTLNIRGKVVLLNEPKVIGILNITPDSFYDGGRFVTEESVMAQAKKITDEGAMIIDIGGYSSRPGARDISVQEELNRVLPHIANIRAHIPGVFISIDTFRARVAQEAVAAGADIINDISAGQLDDQMAAVAGDLDVPYIMMHMRGTPQTMRQHTDYGNLLGEMLDYFQKRIHQFMAKGVKDIILDPGFGFAKTILQNYEILKNLSYFDVLELPLLVGVSRKSMIFKQLHIDRTETLNGTTMLNTVALMNGANFLRVHDVKEAVEVVNLYNCLYNNKEGEESD